MYISAVAGWINPETGKMVENTTDELVIVPGKILQKFWLVVNQNSAVMDSDGAGIRSQFFEIDSEFYNKILENKTTIKLGLTLNRLDTNEVTREEYVDLISGREDTHRGLWDLYLNPKAVSYRASQREREEMKNRFDRTQTLLLKLVELGFYEIQTNEDGMVVYDRIRDLLYSDAVCIDDPGLQESIMDLTKMELEKSQRRESFQNMVEEARRMLSGEDAFSEEETNNDLVTCETCGRVWDGYAQCFPCINPESESEDGCQLERNT